MNSPRRRLSGREDNPPAFRRESVARGATARVALGDEKGRQAPNSLAARPRDSEGLDDRRGCPSFRLPRLMNC